jgi:hypothetical protein
VGLEKQTNKTGSIVLESLGDSCLKGIALSIIVVSTNDLQRLEKTIGSLVPNNKYVEYIFVSPSWNQQSNQVINQFLKRSLGTSKLLNDKGTGVYPAMQLGVNAANGKYICFWNSGDESVSRKSLLNLCKFLDVSQSKWAISLGIFDWLEQQNLTNENLRNFICNAEESLISHQTIFFNRNAFHKVGGYDLKFKVAADTKLIIEFFKIADPAWIDFPTVKVEKPKFASANNKRSRLECFIIALTAVPKEMKIQAIRNILYREVSALRRKSVNVWK